MMTTSKDDFQFGNGLYGKGFCKALKAIEARLRVEPTNIQFLTLKQIRRKVDAVNNFYYHILSNSTSQLLKRFLKMDVNFDEFFEDEGKLLGTLWWLTQKRRQHKRRWYIRPVKLAVNTII
uniref:Uncharacterized protein n=1 Tax=Romanomermis culicivorax TaxID=13658 RepID=A0A915HT00_ROMCU